MHLREQCTLLLSWINCLPRGWFIMADQITKLSAFLDKRLLWLLIKELPEYEEVSQKIGPSPLSQEAVALESELTEALAGGEELRKEQLSKALRLGKLKYEAGDYSGSIAALKSLKAENTEVLWGEVSALVLLQDWKAAEATFNVLAESVSSLRDTAWLLHLALFLSFPSNPGFFVDLALSEKYRPTMKLTSRHLLRYLVAGLLLLKDPRISQIKDIAVSDNDDLLVQLLKCTQRTFDFAEALGVIHQIRDMMRQDFFLRSHAEAIVTEAKKSIVFSYLSIYSQVSISVLATQLDMPADEAEIWIVELARDGQLEVQIEDGLVRKEEKRTDFYSQIEEKLSHLQLRSSAMAQALAVPH